ncbi:MAG: 2Fe-2S iron-sulfur cluster binding domain-containing protein [Planctomycetes bacterium]|nr:2Fe-2S iron-sulfur cluster binding domain-containing protein [Planctomycetota bacterium]
MRFAGIRDVEAKVGTSILEAALANGVELDHACGGVCACSTCHVKVLAGAEVLSEMSDDEADQLDEARDVGLDSRLGCQARILRVPQGGRVEVAIPRWNVNLVREAHD